MRRSNIISLMNPILTKFVIILSEATFEDLSPMNGLVMYDFYELPFLLANRIDPDETPRFATSHLGLRCLYMFLF